MDPFSAESGVRNKKPHGGSPVPPVAGRNGGDKLSPPLESAVAAGAVHDAGGRAEFFRAAASRRVGGIGRCWLIGSSCFSTHEAILTQVLKIACCRAT